MSLRLVGLFALIAGLTTLSVLSKNVPRTCGALLTPQTVQRPHDQRKLVMTEWPNTPVKVNHGKLKRGLAQFGQSRRRRTLVQELYLLPRPLQSEPLRARQDFKKGGKYDGLKPGTIMN